LLDKSTIHQAAESDRICHGIYRKLYGGLDDSETANLDLRMIEAADMLQEAFVLNQGLTYRET